MRTLIRRQTAPLEDILARISSSLGRYDKDREEYEGVPLKFTSVRLKTYVKDGVVCHHCGCAGKYFAIERAVKDRSWHLNLYGVKGDKEVMMTSDHIRPLSGKGSDTLENRQTLCFDCNCEKADKFKYSPEQAAALVDEITLEIKNLNKELEEEKSKQTPNNKKLQSLFGKIQDRALKRKKLKEYDTRTT